MPAATKQLMNNIDFSSIFKSQDLKDRILFTLFILVIYRLGTQMPVPGVNIEMMQQLMAQQSSGLLGVMNTFSGGAMGRYAIFTLSVYPYITASIIMNLLQTAVPHLETLRKEGEGGRKKLNQYTRNLTLLIAIMQSYGSASFIQSMSAQGADVVLNPGMMFKFTTVVILTGGVFLLMWLGEQLTSRGIGNGISVIIFSGIVANLPSAVVATLEQGRTGALSYGTVIFVFAAVASLLVFIVFMEKAIRKIVIQYPKRQASGGRQMTGGSASHLPIKLNISGVIPPIFAMTVLTLPVTLTQMAPDKLGDGVLSYVAQYLAHGKPLYILAMALLIIFFAFFYTSVVFRPEETAENLNKGGAIVPGYRPGKDTADFFDKVTTRLTVVGALYITFVCVLPEFFMGKISIPFYLGGTSILIVVSVAMDTMSQVHSHIISHQYENLLKNNDQHAKRRGGKMRVVKGKRGK